MKGLIYIVFIISNLSCGHNYSPRNYTIAKKTGTMINLTNSNDTLTIGDTIGLKYNITNSLLLDDGSTLKISNINNSGIGYKFLHRVPIGFDTIFNFYPLVVEKNKSYLPDDGRFFFNPLLMPFIGTTIHYIPADTGYFVITTERYQYLVCDIEGSTDQVQINFFPDFNVPTKHEYLLDNYPIAKIAYESGKLNDASPYYCFYVKPK